MKITDCAIIGSGPAGLTAAIYTARANLSPIIIEGHEPGGQLTTTTDVENFPGFPEAITGPELMERMKKQAERFGAQFISTALSSINLSTSPFELTCDNKELLQAKTVIISTGASAKYLGLPKERELIGRGVSACATCDGFFYRNKVVHVVGGGDTAMEEAMFLSRFASKVYILHRREELRASKPMQQRVFENKKIEVIFNTIPIELVADESGLQAIIVEHTQSKERSTRQTDGFFLGIGHHPNTEFLAGQIAVNKQGFIQTTDGTHTTEEGVFACGDVQDSIYRQAITAAGSGCMAAISAERHLERTRNS